MIDAGCLLEYRLRAEAQVFSWRTNLITHNVKGFPLLIQFDGPVNLARTLFLDLPYGPCKGLLVFSSSPWVADIEPTVLSLTRGSNTTITKVNLGGVADSWQTLNWVPKFGIDPMATLDQAQFGYPTIFTLGCGHKLFFIRNLGGADVELRLRETIMWTLP
jgi:hypothetical protein